MKRYIDKITLEFILLIGISLLYASCIEQKSNSDDQTNEERKVTLYDDKTGVKSVIEVNDKMKANGSYKEYYANGVLKRSATYIDGIKEGWEEQFDSLARRVSKVHFSKNQQNGKSFWYSKDGFLESSSFWIADRQYGAIYKFYSDHSIKKYYVKDFQGDVFYITDYDNGKIVKEDGLIFSPAIFFTENKDPLEAAHLLKDTIRLVPNMSIGTTVAVPLETKSKLFLTIRGDANAVTREMEIRNNTAVINRVFTKKGKFNLLFRGEMWKDDKLIKVDTLVRQVVVNY